VRVTSGAYQGSILLFGGIIITPVFTSLGGYCVAKVPHSKACSDNYDAAIVQPPSDKGL